MPAPSPPPVTIAEAARATGLSKHALRYYERVGLIPRVARNASGHRTYTAQDLRWLALADRLRMSGMSIRSIRNYATLVRQGDGTLARRKEILIKHAEDIRARVDELQESLAIVRAKLALYDDPSRDRDALWKLVGEAQARRRAEPDCATP